MDNAGVDAWDMNEMKPDYDAWVLPEENTTNDKDGKQINKNADNAWEAYPSLDRLPRVDPPPGVLDDNSDNTAEQDGWHEVARKHKAPRARVDAGHDKRAKGRNGQQVFTRRYAPA